MFAAAENVNGELGGRRLGLLLLEVGGVGGIAGVGAGNFPTANGMCGITPAAASRTHANQWYLETAADLGIVGLALLVGFLTSMFGRVRAQNLWADPVAIGAFAALLAFSLHGFVDDVMPYPKAALAFFVLVGIIPRRSPQDGAHVVARL